MAPITQIEYFRVPPRWLFVKITDADGNTGWGEASLEGHTEAVEGCLDAFAARFHGLDANAIEHIWQNGYRMGFYRGGPVLMSALAGIDIALWDLKARRLGLPIYEILGGKVRDQLRVYAWIGGDRPGDVEVQARARITQGFKAIKMNATEDLGWLDSPHALDASVERLKAVKALGLDAGVDFHGRVHKAMAIQLAHKLAPHEPLFIEEPLLSEHPESIAALAKLVPIPIALGERLHSRWDIKPFLESASVSILQPDICHVGGISELRRMATMAEAYDVALAPHCPLGPIALAANLQVDAVSANFAIQEMSVGIHYNHGSADIGTYVKNPEVWTVQDGLIRLMAGPGLGIELDEEKIRAAAVDAAAWRSPSFQDLAVAEPPRKRRCGKERVRVTRACDACKRKKLRCSGTLPCSLCQRTSKSCDYTAEYNRGKLPPIPPREQPNTPPRTETTTDFPLESSASPVRENGFANEAPSRGSPEAHQTDMEGHYVGPSSGVSFLIRAQKRLQEQISLPINAPIFSFGDAPLSKLDPAFLLLPPRFEADILIARYFDFAFPTHRFLHQAQVEGWVSEFYGPLQDSAVAGPGKRAIRALVLMVLAHAKQCLPESDQGIGASVNGTLYLAAAEHHLAAETGPVRLVSVQARLAQCFYLLSQSRINHCWSLFGTTARLAIAIGLHRARRRDRGSGFDYVEGECRKRVFWCAYSLDNYLSAALGRPRIFHDDDIDQELPSVANDSHILADQILPATTSAQSIMLAPVYHAKLSVIIGGILHDVYGPRRASGQVEAAAAAKYGASLSRWRQELSGFLDVANVDLLMLTYQRQYTVLNLAFYHAQVLLYRPFILKDFGHSTVTRPQNDKSLESVRKYTGLCLEAAMKIAAIVRELCDRGRMYSTFWFTHYYTFSAIVVLYVHVVQGSTQVDRPDRLDWYLRIAEQAQRDLAFCGSRSSFAQRYVLVLEELRQEARTAINHTRSGVLGSQTVFSSALGPPPSQHGHGSSAPDGAAKANVGEALFGLQPLQTGARPADNQWMDLTSVHLHPQPSHANPVNDGIGGTGITNISDWEALDSLAVAGLGELDYLFPLDGFQDV
ncbi:uncharacterized protein BO66DRAFT_457958 [Aspergillus aculeatinus CBS 121060]|uniref:Uncharacterized protein n=1 Tax=Aspergillus aculeatinus CBS 121060 TaxID=1448322 RepID=A0ACD1H1K2_9EURO|nr:hypothetical protein BO66DRAFT_457958 [Aspergillus aculeatinus CBS 121060]RAH67462.1 hypothetical protein BO66DRAFT_457958 [Aspergillus aculeatinus CBS 121060]